MPFRPFMIPTTPTLKCFVRRGKKSPFSNIFWKINVARESPQDRKNILYGSTIALNCILERLLSRENCFLVRHLNRKLKTPGALLRRTNIKFHIQTAAVCEHWALQCFREDLQNPGAWGLMEKTRKVYFWLLKLKRKVLHGCFGWNEDTGSERDLCCTDFLSFFRSLKTDAHKQ